MHFKNIAAFSCLLFSCSSVMAGDMGSSDGLPSWFHPVVAVQGGYSSSVVGSGSQSYLDSSGNLFTYNTTNNGTNTGFVGGFLGDEISFSWFTYPNLLLQLGVEYNYFAAANAQGINTVGLDSALATTYNYSYQVQTQQVVGAAKLLATVYDFVYPYGEVGLGTAFNQANQYNFSTTDTGSINLTPNFNAGNFARFSYNLGLGIDAQAYKAIRVGLGYRYSYFGAPSLGDGSVNSSYYHYPVPFTLNNSDASANQLLARISYIA